jgi:hypothetical protein
MATAKLDLENVPVVDKKRRMPCKDLNSFDILTREPVTLMA